MDVAVNESGMDERKNEYNPGNQTDGNKRQNEQNDVVNLNNDQNLQQIIQMVAQSQQMMATTLSKKDKDSS